jgi:hypothetical protein
MAEFDACLESIGKWNEVIEKYKFKTRKSQVWVDRTWQRERARRLALQPETDEDLIAAYDEMAEFREAESTLPPVPATAPQPEFKCPTCEDSGEVVPDAFGVGEPWPKYLETIKDSIERYGMPSMIHPLPCPACRPAAPPPATELVKDDSIRVTREDITIVLPHDADAETIVALLDVEGVELENPF